MTDETLDPAARPDVPSRWELWPLHWLGAAAGGAVGLADGLLVASLGVDIRWGEQDAGFAVLALFSVTYMGLGYVVGRLVQAHALSRRHTHVITTQLAELERAQLELIQQEKLAAIGRLAAGVAHEVRNPLGVIRASAAMVQESFEPGEDPHKACEFICEEIDRLNGLITALLSFSRPAEPRRVSVCLDSVAERALELASEALQRHGIRARLRPDGPSQLRADPNLVSQVVYGLVSNAVEALEAPAADMPAVGGDASSADRGHCIEVRTGADASLAYVEVADDGPGIPAESAAKIFEPFFTTKASGTGLGLPMALRIAEAHGGSLRTVSGRGAGERGSGACFRLELPLDEGATARAAP